MILPDRTPDLDFGASGQNPTCENQEDPALVPAAHPPLTSHFPASHQALCLSPRKCQVLTIPIYSPFPLLINGRRAACPVTSQA